MILFGGGNTVAFNDTWAWTARIGARGCGHRPGKRFNHAMAYDRGRQEIVLFGGLDENVNFYADTWAWTGARWTLRQASGGPPVRSDFGMAFDPVNAEVVISPGFEGQNDTWGWNGRAWTRKFPSHLPPSTSNYFCQMTYDERLQRAVMVMHNVFGTPQTWVWNGFDWSPLSPAQSPTPRAASGIVYDGVRGQVLLFGGDGTGGPLNDTWVLAPPTAILSLQSVSVSKNALGNYLVTFALRNTGNTAANAVFEIQRDSGGAGGRHKHGHQYVPPGPVFEHCARGLRNLPGAVPGDGRVGRAQFLGSGRIRNGQRGRRQLEYRGAQCGFSVRGDEMKLRLLLMLIAGLGSLQAGSLLVVLSSPSQTGAPGDLLKFLGTMANVSPTDTIFLNSIASTSGTGNLNPDVGPFFVNAPLFLAPGDGTGLFEIFDVDHRSGHAGRALSGAGVDSRRWIPERSTTWLM